MPAAVPDRGAQRAGDEAVPLVSVAPGRRPPFFAADILFIHAHPDDESLDFGALLARSAAAGLATVTVLFTDGEAGNDRYPRRSVNGDYPDRRLRGRELAALRVREAERALGLLGCRMYVRLGLANHPYNSQSDKLTPEEVIEAWGGEEVLAARLADIIRGFSPRIVVGPDRQSAATEHFEHEAVGQILRRALAMLAAGGGPSPREVLVGVDPRQKSRYRGLIAVPAAEAGNARGESFREIQLRALKEYASQQDAALGLELLPRYRAEYYLPLFNAEEPFLPVAPGD
jgi:LmbE family N-acetylglucosaminyl deacetylase